MFWCFFLSFELEGIPQIRPPLRLGHPPPEYENNPTLTQPLPKQNLPSLYSNIQKIDRNSKWCYEGEQVLNVFIPQLTYTYGPYCVEYRKNVFRNR